MSTANPSRRGFLRRSATLAAGTAPLLTGLIRAAQAASFGDGYKALVCVYLAGGNDSFNMLVPRSADEHAAYVAARQFLAVPRETLREITPATYRDAASYGFHPNMPEVQALFNENKLAVMANVGPLIAPITADEYNGNSVPVPAQLFSHNDQTDLWMSASAGTPNGRGWAGQMIDRFYGAGQAVPKPSPSISVGGANLWQTGDAVRPFEITAGGVSSLDFPYHDGPLLMDAAYREIYKLAAASAHPMIREHAGIQRRAIEFGQLVNDALTRAPTFAEPFGAGSLQAQLQMVARLIAVRNNLDPATQRQVFFVQLGGWDTHASQNEPTANSHPNLLGQLSKSLGAFQAAMEQLGVAGQVTIFTATEFGRTLTPNGNGTDHGWGGHNLVMGGAVNGGDIYGQMPDLSPDTNAAVETGRIIPTTAVDQYAATLASWFGLSQAEVSQLFPNLGNFSSANLGFV